MLKTAKLQRHGKCVNCWIKIEMNKKTCVHHTNFSKILCPYPWDCVLTVLKQDWGCSTAASLVLSMGHTSGHAAVRLSQLARPRNAKAPCWPKSLPNEATMFSFRSILGLSGQISHHKTSSMVLLLTQRTYNPHKLWRRLRLLCEGVMFLMLFARISDTFHLRLGRRLTRMMLNGETRFSFSRIHFFVWGSGCSLANFKISRPLISGCSARKLSIVSLMNLW